jgi:hypothetical protein
MDNSLRVFSRNCIGDGLSIPDIDFVNVDLAANRFEILLLDHGIVKIVEIVYDRDSMAARQESLNEV